ncbi:MAG: beta-ketoacyl-ACP synthase III [Syntrophobacterales bacterium]|nr:beta-ketoacyl-ACP synthase III [Syntrophobacterales bacterium]
MNQVFITKLAAFLPNEPISNDGIEDILGMVNGQPSKLKSFVLKRNGIKTRYYAVNRHGALTHSNAELTACAIRNLQDDSFCLDDIDLLCCGASIPDQIIPSHASMVHGCLGISEREIISTSGACCCGIQALKYGMLAVGGGHAQNAVCTASEMVSPLILSRNYERELENLQALKKRPIIAFEKDFLRWMLSDGAGAVLLERNPNRHGLSLRVDWIDIFSFAGEIPTCMYAGAQVNNRQELIGWKSYRPEEWLEQSIFTIKQDVKLLAQHVVKTGAKQLAASLKKRQINPQDIDYLLPHISSEYFRKPLAREMKGYGIDIPQERWFTNLSSVGNIGSAAPYVMLAELFHGGKLAPGMKILVLVPESSRFTYAFVSLTVC